MKRIIYILVFLVLLVSLSSCSNSNYEINYGNSNIYSKQEMDEAIKIILKEFNNWEGCKLYSISYTSDECNNIENIEWMNDLEKANDNKEVFTECIIFDVDFRSPVKGGGAWNPNKEYKWSFCLGRSEDGHFKLMTWGFC